MDLVIGLGGVWTPAECDGLSGDGPAAKDSRADVSDGFAAYVDWTDSNPSVPILMAHGTADPVCSIEVARAAADELEANGHPVELLVFEGGGHAGGMLFLDDENDAAAASADPDAAEGREVVTAIVAALSAASESGPDGQASASMEVDTVTDLEYLSTETESFALDVYQPEGDGPYPVIVLFHGATAEGKDSHHTRRMAEALAASGLVVFAPTWNAEFTTLTGDGWLETHGSGVVRTGVRRGACRRSRRGPECARDVRLVGGCPSGRMAGAGPWHPRRRVRRRHRSDRPRRRGPDRQRVLPAHQLLPTHVPERRRHRPRHGRRLHRPHALVHRRRMRPSGWSRPRSRDCTCEPSAIPQIRRPGSPSETSTVP